MAKLKQKQCAANGCTEMFTPRNMKHRTHHYECAIQYQKELTEKRKAKEHRRIKKEFKQNDKSHLIKIAQQVFNKYIRTRDRDLPCISCTHNGDRQRHASHFRPTGRNSALRFNDDNCHSSCSICNQHLSGNLIPYRVALIEKIGEERVDALESMNEPKSWTVEELKEIIDTYKSKIRGLDE